MVMSSELMYRVSFYPGCGGRFISTMLDMLVSPNSEMPTFSNYNSSHLARRPNAHNSVNTIHQNHLYPDVNENYQDIVIIFSLDDLAEIAVNNLYKNIFENLLLIEQGLPPIDQYFTQDSFLKLYKETHYVDYTGPVSDLSQASILRLVRQMIKWSIWDITHTDQQFTVIGTDPKTLYIKYSDIFTPAGTSWRALHQLCKFTRRSASSDMQTAWATYASNRKNLIDNELKWLYNSL